MHSHGVLHRDIKTENIMSRRANAFLIGMEKFQSVLT